MTRHLCAQVVCRVGRLFPDARCDGIVGMAEGNVHHDRMFQLGQKQPKSPLAIYDRFRVYSGRNHRINGHRARAWSSRRTGLAKSAGLLHAVFDMDSRSVKQNIDIPLTQETRQEGGIF